MLSTALDAHGMPEIRTERLLLRPWRAGDAALLLPVLIDNTAHLAPWIPAHVAAAVPLDQLAARLAGFADDFTVGRAWRFGVFTPAGADVLGEASLFFRSAAGRVHRDAADRVEIGYWLRHDVTGRGYATEAARALFDMAKTLRGMTHVEIRCDARNAASAAVPHRLGFRRAPPDAAASSGDDREPAHTMIWWCRLSVH